jgi:hypothetical protein
MAEKLQLSESRGVGKTLMLFYYPHFLTAAHQEWYYHYISWWVGKTPTHGDYLEFRSNFVHDPE